MDFLPLTSHMNFFLGGGRGGGGATLKWHNIAPTCFSF